MGYQDIKQLMKDARDLAEGANDLQLKGKLLNIQSYLYDLLDENKNLRLENEKMRNDKLLRERLLKEGTFWKDPKKPDYLYCPVCWGKEEKLIPADYFKDSDYGEIFKCPVCGYWSNHF
jgi:hypothetical protein